MRTRDECQNFYYRFFPPALLPFLLLLGLILTATSCGSQSKAKHLARGEEYLQKRKFDEAVMEFRTASDIDKQSGEAHWGLARAFESLGQLSETINELRAVADLQPENLEAKIKLGNYYLLIAPPQTDEVQKILDDVLARNPKYVEAHVLKASLFAAQKKSEKEILNVLGYAVALDPNRAETYMSVARYFSKIGKPQEAENAINKGISIAPLRSLGYIEYGRFLDSAGRLSEAETQYKRAAEAEPKNIEARQAVAEFYLKQRQFDRAEQTYKELVFIQEDSPEARVDLAGFYSAVGRDDEAIGVLSDILKNSPEFARARYRLGEIYLERRQNELVSEQLDTLLKANDTDAEALMLRARLRLQENRAEDAVKDLEEILKKQPSQRNALFYMTQARLALGQIEPARAFIADLEKYHPNYLRAKLLKIQADFADDEPQSALREAADLFQAATNAYPNAENTSQQLEDLRVRALTARGLANLELGKLAEARADLQQVQKLSPNSAAAMVNLAKVFVAEKNTTEALKLYNNALTADAKNFDALAGLIGILKAQKQFGEARARIDQLIAQDGNQRDARASLHYLKADVFTAEKNQVAAEDELKTAIETDGEYLPAYSAFAAILLERNQRDAAVEQYNKVIGKKPSASIYTLLGMLEEGRGNFAQAEKNYRKALGIESDAPVAANNLAWLIADNNQGNLDEALQFAEKAVSKNQSIAAYLDTLGWVYYKKGLFLPAIEQMKKAVVLDQIEAKRRSAKINPAYRARLGTILAAAGDKNSARRELEASLQNADSLSQKEMQSARNLLASL